MGLLGASLWLAHPLFVSTTLYVVQRMAMLAALFVFAGLTCYVTGRRHLDMGRPHSGYALMIGGLVGGTLLGFFSKENAALLPLLALVLEVTVLRHSKLEKAAHSSVEKYGHKKWQFWYRRCAGRENAAPIPGSPSRIPNLAFRLVFLWLPSAFIFAYLLWPLRDIATLVPGRDFSVGTRLLTEARVLVYYLYLLVIPHAQTHGLYTIVPLSHGVLHPWTTLPAIGIILALLAAAFAGRRRWPVFAAVILFFFAGQLLESTTLPLELYYEHRNYLPAALLFWPLALWFVRGPGRRALRYATLVLAFVLLLTLTGLRANLWGQPTRLALTWMRLNPDSVRAVVAGTDTLTALGKNRLAYGRLYFASKTNPDNISITLARIGAACRLGGARPEDVQALVYAAGHDWTRLHLLYTALSGRLENGKPPCPGFGPRAMAAVVAGARGNVHYQGNKIVQQNLFMLRGQLALREHESKAAYTAFRTALTLHPIPAVALTAGAYLLNAGHPCEAQQLLNTYRSLPRHLPSLWSMKGLHRRWLDRTGWYRNSFRNLHNTIEKTLHRSGTASPQ